MKIKNFFAKKQHQIDTTGRTESFQEEILYEAGISEWEKSHKEEQERETEILFSEIENIKETAKNERKEVFLQKSLEAQEAGSKEFEQVSLMKGKINADRKRALKERDVAFRNKSILG